MQANYLPEALARRCFGGGARCLLLSTQRPQKGCGQKATLDRKHLALKTGRELALVGSVDVTCVKLACSLSPCPCHLGGSPSEA